MSDALFASRLQPAPSRPRLMSAPSMAEDSFGEWRQSFHLLGWTWRGVVAFALVGIPGGVGTRGPPFGPAENVLRMLACGKCAVLLLPSQPSFDLVFLRVFGLMYVCRASAASNDAFRTSLVALRRARHAHGRVSTGSLSPAQARANSSLQGGGVRPRRLRPQNHGFGPLASQPEAAEAAGFSPRSLTVAQDAREEASRRCARAASFPRLERRRLFRGRALF